MYIEQLQIKSLRNLSEVLLQPEPGLNLLIGKNASGKTAVLEAIYFLSRARSFRTTRLREVLQYGKDVLQVSAKLQLPGALPPVTGPIATGIEKGCGKGLIRYNGESVRSVSTQARQVPLILITPDSHQLVTGTPRQRRHWLDWAMFHVEPDYLNWWRSYHRSLRQRNCLLRAGKSLTFKELVGWEQAMFSLSGSIQAARSEFIGRLTAALQAVLGDALPDSPEILLRRGWPEDKPLLKLLAQGRKQDSRAGYTRYGPHKANVSFRIHDKNLSAACSRGQIKLFVNALLVAQAQVYESYNQEKPVFLVDDFAAELDHEAQRRLLELLGEQAAQVFLTTTELRQRGDINGRMAMFHVEHGKVLRVAGQACF